MVSRLQSRSSPELCKCRCQQVSKLQIERQLGAAATPQSIESIKWQICLLFAVKIVCCSLSINAALRHLMWLTDCCCTSGVRLAGAAAAEARPDQQTRRRPLGSPPRLNGSSSRFWQQYRSRQQQRTPPTHSYKQPRRLTGLGHNKRLRVGGL